MGIKNGLTLLIRRSTLIVPVIVQKFVEKAYLRGADAICLDLEDSVPSDRKSEARSSVKQALVQASKGGADILVRINSPYEMAVEDLRASLWPGLTGILFPKAETAQQVKEIDGIIDNLERERRLPARSVELNPVIESAKGLLNAFDVATASRRTKTISLGDEDFCLDLGIEPTKDAQEVFFAKAKLVLVATAVGIAPLGLMGTISDFSDLDGFRASAVRAKNMGFKGASAIHPNQIKILNEVFSPSQQEVEHARNVVKIFQGSLQQGRAATNLNGKMIDIPVFERAKRTLEFAERIELARAKKAIAMDNR